MKVLAIVASGRKDGNVSRLCKSIIEGASKAGHETELINLHDYNIGYCTGCLSCTKTQKCAIKDDFEILLTKEMQADFIVYGTPIYSHDIAGILKSYIDRHSCLKLPYVEVDKSVNPPGMIKQVMNYLKEFNGREPFKGKRCGIVAACSDRSTRNKQIRQVQFVMKNFIENEMRAKITNTIICANTLFENNNEKIDKLMKMAYDIGNMIK